MIGLVSYFQADVIFFYNLIFWIFSKYQPLLLLTHLLTFLIHAYLSQTVQVSELLDAAKIGYYLKC